MGQCMSSRNLEVADSSGNKAGHSNLSDGNTTRNKHIQSSADHFPLDKTMGHSVVKQESQHRPKKNRCVKENKAPKKKDILSNSGHRRETLKYQSNRRVELEKAVADKKPGNEILQSRARKYTIARKDSWKKESLVLPSIRQAKPRLTRQNSWFPSNYTSDMFNIPTETPEEKEEETDTEMDTSYLHDSNSSWGELGLVEDDTGVVAPGQKSTTSSSSLLAPAKHKSVILKDMLGTTDDSSSEENDDDFFAFEPDTIRKLSNVY